VSLLIRSAIAALLVGTLVLAGAGYANTASFDSRATALERAWNADQAAGVTPAQLAPARTSLRELRDRRVAFLPYSAFSGALLVDPFGRPEALANQAQAEAITTTRARAQDDLAHLKDLAGPNYPAYQDHSASLAAARQLTDYVRLVRAWETELGQLTQLSEVAGGLADGLPRDVVDGVARLQNVISAASKSQLSADPAAQALARAQEYLKQQQTATLLEQHDAIAGEVKSAGDTVQHRVDTRVQANTLVGRLPDLLGQASKWSVSADYQSRATQAKADVVAAETAGDDARMDTATANLKTAIDRLSSAVGTARKASGCLESAPDQLIVIHTATQKLIAYDHGCPILTTLVTTGRPALRTDVGTFTIRAKYTSYLMHSPWPPGDPLWYPDTTVHNAMLVNPADGTYIHSAEWEPESAYGPGSQNGSYASHGCIHVMNGPLATLYAWAQNGATVSIPAE
jgi:lipoprotein-anchoring transpeptidase ErfK/SrfK